MFDMQKNVFDRFKQKDKLKTSRENVCTSTVNALNSKIP